MKSFDVCPQKLWTFEAPEKVLEESKAFCEGPSLHDNKRQHQLFKYDDGCDFNRCVSTNTQLQRHPELENTVKWFHKCCNAVKDHYGMPTERLKITECWVNAATDKGMMHKKHKHFLTVISGIFYVSESNSGTIFYDRDWFVYDNLMMGMKPEMSERRGKIVPPVKTEFPNSPGTLIIFPAGVLHGVKPHKGDTPRYTISFNTFMDGKCGHQHGAGYVDLSVN